MKPGRRPSLMRYTNPFRCAFEGVCRCRVPSPFVVTYSHLIIGWPVPSPSPHSWTLIAHATSEIVEGCSSHHPMLMLSLLGVTLAHGLYTESKIFLRLFLTALFRQPPRHGVAPPIAHPMHPSYLVELCQEWTRLAPGSCAGPFTLRSFAAVTLEVLAEHGSAAAWTCKSITRLVQLLRTRDFECFLTFLHGLIEALAARPRHSARGREEDHSLLHPRLAKWTGVITSDFFSVEEDARRCGAGNSRSYSHLEFYSIVEILASAHDAGLHLPVIDDDDDPDVRAPQAALVCAATHCLTSPLFSTVNTAHRHAVLALLHNVNIASAPPTTSTPTTTTTTTTTTTIFDILANQPLARLRTLAAALRAHNLGALEQALWTCAIEHGADPALVDVPAESVCVWEGGDVVAGRGRIRRAAPTRSPPRKRKRPHRETPPPRRASQRQQLPSPSPSPSSSSSSSSMSISVASTPPLSSAASSSSSTRSLPGTPVPSLGEIMARPSGDEDEEATQRPCAGVAMRLRGDSFKSVLADALRTRKDLRAERRRASSLRTIGRYYVCSVSSERGYSREEDAAALALSSEGDVLDMFAYDDPF